MVHKATFDEHSGKKWRVSHYLRFFLFSQLNIQLIIMHSIVLN